MTLETLLALMGFAFVTSVTPGPSNLILLASGANHGLRRTLPLVFGINLSFLSMLLVVGFGLGQLLRAEDALHDILKAVSLAYVLWLAWRIADSSPSLPDAAPEDGVRPLTFWQMAMLQWVNPKAWAVALAVTVAYTTPENYAVNLLTLTGVFGLVNLPSIGVWAVSGTALKRFLSTPGKVRVFNILMAALLVVSMIPIVTGIGTG